MFDFNLRKHVQPSDDFNPTPDIGLTATFTDGLFVKGRIPKKPVGYDPPRPLAEGPEDFHKEIQVMRPGSLCWRI